MRHATLRQLRAFAIVARHRSFARAACDLRLSPSAVSLQIRELEAALRLPLLDRSGRVVSLTDGGERVLAEVDRILAALDQASRVLEHLRGDHSDRGGRVTVGMVGNAQYFVPRLLARFHEARDDIGLTLRVGNREQLLEQLQRGGIDLAIMGAPPQAFDGRAEAFSSQSLGIVAANDHALTRRRSIPASDLVRQGFIVREPGSGTRSAMERFFRSADIQPPRVMEMSSNESIKQAVMADMGLAFVSLQSVALELQAQLLVSLDVVGLPLVRPWYVLSNSSVGARETVAHLRRFILEAGDRDVMPECPPAFQASPLDTSAPVVDNIVR